MGLCVLCLHMFDTLCRRVVVWLCGYVVVCLCVIVRLWICKYGQYVSMVSMVCILRIREHHAVNPIW